MSLLSTLAKVAVGVAVAKGVQSITQGAASARTTGSRGGSSGGGSLGDLLGGMLAGGAAGGAGSGSVFGGANSPGAGGALGQILAGRSAGQTGGGLGGLLDGLSKASNPSQAQVGTPSSGSLGDLLNQSLEHFGEPPTPPTPSQEDQAKIMLRAMLQAAKSDGRIDANEKKKLLGQLGDISKDEMAFINAELAAPVDVAGLAAQVPPGMGSQVYLMSLMGIDLDSEAEAKYLDQLAKALRIAPAEANAIHQHAGMPTIYR